MTSNFAPSHLDIGCRRYQTLLVQQKGFSMQHWRLNLRKFLADHFTSTDLARLATAYIPDIQGALPGPTATHNDFVSAFIEATERHHQMPELFDAISAERPRCESDVHELRRMWTDETEAKRPPSAERSPFEWSWKPDLDPEADFVKSFVGREDCFATFQDALSGLRAKFEGLLPPSETAKTRLIWVHGMGGMGKSWFLRRAAWLTGTEFPEARVCLVDYDDTEWRCPNTGDPVTIRDLLAPIAHRVAQHYGEDALEPWREADEMVRRSEAHQRDLKRRFDDSWRLLEREGEQWRTASEMSADVGAERRKLRDDTQALQDHMHKTRLWTHDPAELRERLVALGKRQLGGKSDYFGPWKCAVLPGAAPELTDPAGMLVNALRESLAAAAASRPLVLILDTCELLNYSAEDLDSRLRNLVAPLIAQDSDFLLLIGSRLAPDEGSDSTSERWPTRIARSRLKRIAFDESKQFDVEEIERLVASTHPPVTETRKVSILLERISLGIPLLVGVYLDLHRSGDTQLEEFVTRSDLEPEMYAERREIIARATRAAAVCFLKHLEHRVDRVDDYTDVIALGTLMNPSQEILRRYFGASSLSDRRRALNRYALISGTDLHQAVRRLVRLCWRTNPPAQLANVVRRLLAVVRDMLVGMPRSEPKAAGLLVEEANLASWVPDEQAMTRIWGAFAVLHTFGHNLGSLLPLVAELHSVTAGDDADLATLTRALSPEVLWWHGRLENAGEMRARLTRVTGENLGREEVAALSLLRALAAYGEAENRGRERTLTQRALNLYEQSLSDFASALEVLGLRMPTSAQTIEAMMYAAAYCARAGRSIEQC